MTMPSPAACEGAAAITGAEAGRLIRSARQVKGLTQRELGALVGLSQSEVSRLERRGVARDPEVLPRIAAVLDVAGDLLCAALAGGHERPWRQWVWASRRKPYEKLLLLALLDSCDAECELDALMARTGLGAGSARSMADRLRREGLLRIDLDRARRRTVIALARRPGDRLR
jgi:transcriptional regulator with XRE-family HTH domain